MSKAELERVRDQLTDAQIELIELKARLAHVIAERDRMAEVVEAAKHMREQQTRIGMSTATRLYAALDGLETQEAHQ